MQYSEDASGTNRGGEPNAGFSERLSNLFTPALNFYSKMGTTKDKLDHIEASLGELEDFNSDANSQNKAQPRRSKSHSRLSNLQSKLSKRSQGLPESMQRKSKTIRESQQIVAIKEESLRTHKSQI
mmetsp:Transcript_28145/g.42579  ORF Transcript_28145/g.42579 Transcript_28145/m.42579 type:complete len:126 (+) Transcript_28145:20-397(+)